MASQPTYRPTRQPSPRTNNGIYGNFGPDEYPDKNVQQIIVAMLIILLLVMMACEVSTPEILFLIALVIVILAEILTLQEGLAGFSNNALITIGTLFLVIAAVEKSHVVDWLARKSFGTKGSIIMAKVRMYFSCFGLSIFFNNTPLVAILIPIVKDWGRVRGVAASQLLMPLSFAVLAGSFGSMIGTSTNLTVQGLMEADRGYAFSFFAPLPIGATCAVALIVYMIVAGPYILPVNKTGLLSEIRDKAETLIAEVYVSPDAVAVGMKLGDMMISLGLAPSYAIKIRRRNQPDDSFADVESNKKSSGVDASYIHKQFKNWYSGAADFASRFKAPSFRASEIEYDASPDDYVDIITPSFNEKIRAGDIVFMSYAQDVIEKMMKSILGESSGLYVMKSNAMLLPGFGTEIAECVISDTNPLVGLKTADIAKTFAERYKAGFVTVRGKDWSGIKDFVKHELSTSAKHNKNEDSDSTDSNGTTAIIPAGGLDNSYRPVNDHSAIPQSESGIELSSIYPKSDDVRGSENDSAGEETKLNEVNHLNVVMSEHLLRPGDVILCVTSEKELENLRVNRDFFVVSTVGNLPKPLTLYTFFPCAVFAAMLIVVAMEYIDICPASLAVASVFFIGGWINFNDIPRVVDIRLLMLLGTSLSFATSMTKSGLALRIAQLIEREKPTSFNAILLVYAVTLVITELISNNAAAALMYPIAVGLADELGVSFKPFAMAVLIASTAGFMSPIGYQTHVMVWGPGGYRFRDFVIFGFVPDLLYWFISCAVIPTLYPFNE
jgi:di/tricarboxylate transporter